MSNFRIWVPKFTEFVSVRMSGMSGRMIKVFQNEQFGQLRAMLGHEGEPLMMGTDVAKRLGYKNPAKALRDHVDTEDKLTERIVLSGQRREVIFINESGLYSLILSSCTQRNRPRVYGMLTSGPRWPCAMPRCSWSLPTSGARSSTRSSLSERAPTGGCTSL